jgi:hypothetical protein
MKPPKIMAGHSQVQSLTREVIINPPALSPSLERISMVRRGTLHELPPQQHVQTQSNSTRTRFLSKKQLAETDQGTMLRFCLFEQVSHRDQISDPAVMIFCFESHVWKLLSSNNF